MARIPRYNERVGLGGVDTPSRAVVPNLDSGIGDSLRRLAATGEQAFQRYDAGQQRQGVAWAEAQSGQAAQWLNDAYDRLRTTPTSDLPAAQQKLDGEWQAYRDKVLGAAPQGYARQFAEKTLGQQYERTQARVRAHATQAFEAQKVADLETGLGGKAIALRGDPSQFMEYAAQSSVAIENAGVDSATQTRLKEQMRTMYAKSAVQGLIDADPARAAAEIRNPDTNVAAIRELDPEIRAAALKVAEQAAVETKVNGAVAGVLAAYTGNFREGSKALEQLLASDTLSADEKASVQARVQSQVNLLQDRRRQENVDGLARLEQLQATGDPSADRLAGTLYNRGALTEAQYAGALGQTARARAERAKAETDANALNAAIAAGQKFDPADSDAKKAVAAYFTAQTAGAAPGSPLYLAAATGLAQRTNIVPQPAVSWARSALVSENPADAVAGADLLARLDAANPSAFGFAVDERTRAMASQIVDAVQAGAPAALAVQTARKNADRPESERKLFEQRYKDLDVAKRNGGALRSLLNADDRYDPKWWGGAPDVPPALAAEFDAGVSRYFPLVGGDAEKARELAFRDVTRKWGRSEVNGKPELIPYAPEVMFPGLTPDLVRSDLAATLGGAAPAKVRRLDPATGKPVDATVKPEHVRLVPIDSTARTNGAVWGLGVVDEYGALDLLRQSNGLPIRYQLPVAVDSFTAARKRQQEAEITAAEQRRAMRDEANAQRVQAALDEARQPSRMQGR